LLCKQRTIRIFLSKLPQYVGSSYDSAAWSGCMTALGRQVAGARGSTNA